MNIENMRAFLEIASAGSFQDAAQRLHITQSAISARIKHLEERLNRQLYLRKRSGVELTHAGQQFLRHAQYCVQSWERAQQEIALPVEIDNIIGLGVHLYYWDRVINPWSSWMELHASQFATRIVSEYSDKLLSMLRDGMLDLALVYQVRQNANFTVEDFSEETLVLVSTEHRAINTGWTPGYIMVDWGDKFSAEHAAAFPDSPPPKLVIGSEAVALAHVLKNGGSGYFLESDVAVSLESGTLVRVKDAPTFKRKSYLVYRKDTAIPEPINTAIHGLREVLINGANL